MLLLCCGMVPASASAAGTGSYVALGDSISAGYGLVEGELSFPEVLERDTGYVLTDFSSNDGVTSEDLLETLQDSEVAAAVRDADVITITVGGNDLMNALYEYLADAPGVSMTADQIRDGLVNGTIKDPLVLLTLMDSLSGFPGSSRAEDALKALGAHLSSALEQIKLMNPDVTCIIANQYNPYGHINNQAAADIVSTFEVGVQALNTTLERVAQAQGATVADVHSAFAASSANPCNAYFTGLNNFSLDFHPNALGHQLIAEEVEQALPEPDPVQTYDVWVAGTQVSDDNAGDVLGDSTVSYAPASQTLTLNNAAIDYQENAGDNTKGAIMFEGDLTIVLKGDNRITSVTSGISCAGAGALTVRGDQLTIESTSYGIGYADAGRAITVSGAKLTIEVDTMPGFTAAGIQAGRLLTIADGAVVDITGATDEAAALIGNGGISIVDSTVSARIAAAGAYGIGVILSDRDITIDNSIVDVHADHAYNFGILAGNDLIPSEGTISITNNSQVIVSAAAGIALHTMTGDIEIEDSTVEAAGGYKAVYARGDLTISGAADVTAQGLSPYSALSATGACTLDPAGQLVDVWTGTNEDDATKIYGSPVSQITELSVRDEYFHSAPHAHAFTERVEDDAYLASAATCTEPASYYLSCACGEAGTDTFTAGTALGHSWGAWEVVTPATCTEPGAERRTCASCGTTESREIAATGHDFVDGACAACGEKDPSFVNPDESALPAAGDAGSLAALVPALAGASALATGILLRRRG